MSQWTDTTGVSIRRVEDDDNSNPHGQLQFYSTKLAWNLYIGLRLKSYVTSTCGVRFLGNTERS